MAGCGCKSTISATKDGSLVSVYTDVTELKHRQQELEQARDAAEVALERLRATQQLLVVQQKMAALGQLTAGIAHEIKNPLNFVNNFSALSTELVDELSQVLASQLLGDTVRPEVEDLTKLLKSNLEKVVQHGQRADGIVKNMLLHSRESSGEMRSVDLNTTVEEALNLAYHGARADKPGFNVRLVRNYDPAAGSLDLYPQEFTRVLLNLISNGFYASARRKTDGGDPGFEPALTVSTEALTGGGRHPRPRQRRRRQRERKGAHVRTVLHDEAPWRRHRPWPLAQPRHRRQAAWRDP